MKVNKFNVLSLSRIGKAVKLMAFVAVLSVFGSQDANAQYMQRDLAVQTLTSEMQVLVDRLDTQIPHSATYNYTASLAKYYKLMIQDLTENFTEVKTALTTNIDAFVAEGKPRFTVKGQANVNTPLSEQDIISMKTAAHNLLSI